MMEIDIWPHERFAYYARGWHSVRYFRERLLHCRGVQIAHGTGRFQFFYALPDDLEPVFQPVPGSFPVMVWSAGV